jgi:predicted nucleic acid-binding protein
MSYWDTSALLKLYLTELDSADFKKLLKPAGSRVTAFIGKHEARTAFRRREAEGHLAHGGAVICYARLEADVAAGWVSLLPESPAVEKEFADVLERCLSQSPPVFVRTNDALHLAAARVAGELDFISADHKQRTAAAFLGFNVLPSVYPLPSPTT